MELLDNEDLLSEDPRETGNIDLFDPKIIPLQTSSYLGQFPVGSLHESAAWSVNCVLYIRSCPPGFSIDSGMALVRRGELTIVAGAPRGGYSGQVAFLTPDPAAKRSLSVAFVLSGPGLASSFGYDVAVVDLNGDG